MTDSRLSTNNRHTYHHYRSSFTMSTPRAQLVRRLSTVGGRIIRGEKKASPEEPAFTSHLNAATTFHRQKLRESRTQIVRQQDVADASSPVGASNRKSDSMGVWSEAHRNSATARNRKSEDNRYEKMQGASTVAPKSATEVYRTERAKKRGEFFTTDTIDEANKVKSSTAEKSSSGESATRKESSGARGLVPVLAIASGSALVLYNFEALQGML